MIDPFDPAQRGALLADARIRVAEHRMSAAFPPRFTEADLGSVRALHGAGVAEPLERWCSSPGVGLVLIGPTGTGKTWAAAAVARKLAPILSVRYHHSAGLLAGLRPDGGLSYSAVANVGLLVVDDVGAERVTDWAAEQLTAIVDARWTYERPTIITSNLSPTDLADHLGARAWSRLTGAGSLVLRLAGVDNRKDNPPS